MNSALYFGNVRHRRFTGPRREFGYRLYLPYLDLEELDHVFRGRWFWSARRPALARFRRQDYLGDARQPLDQAVRDRVEKELGRRPDGPIRILTNLRTFGYCFNPVTFYYCHRADGQGLDSLVAEITNTPWNERHAYVLDAHSATGHGAALRWQFPKSFHVSPFLGMDYEYDWRFTPPGEQLVVHMENRSAGEVHLDATLTMERRPLDGRHLALALTRHPFMAAKVVAGIYWQALRLKMQRAPFHPHPTQHTGVGA